MDNYIKHNYCHACHTRFAVFFILPSYCVRSLVLRGPHSRSQNPVRFLLSCKADSRLQGPLENIPTVIQVDLKTEQNKTKTNKQTNKKAFAVGSLLGQTGKILLPCMNNFFFQALYVIIETKVISQEYG